MLNGDAVAEPLVRFAAVFRRRRVYVVVCDIRCIDRGFYMDPSFWPVLVIIVLMKASMIVGSGNKG